MKIDKLKHNQEVVQLTYQSMGTAVAILNMRTKIVENAIKNLLEIYVNENDADEQKNVN